MAPRSPPSAQGAERHPAAGLALGALGVTIFGATLPVTRLAVRALDPVFVTAGRAAVAGLLAGAVLLVLRRRPPPRAHWPRLLTGTACLACGFPLFSGLGVARAEASHGAVVLAILPLATAVAATLVAHERPTPRFWALAALGTLVVLTFVLVQSAGRWGLADGLFLLAATSAAFGYAASGSLSRTMPGWEVICWQVVAGLPLSVPVALAFAPPALAEVPASCWVAFAYLSLFSMFLGFFAWNTGLAWGGVARVGQVQLLQVFVTLGVSAALLGERVAPLTWAFAAAVVVIVALGRRARVAS